MLRRAVPLLVLAASCALLLLALCRGGRIEVDAPAGCSSSELESRAQAASAVTIVRERVLVDPVAPVHAPQVAKPPALLTLERAFAGGQLDPGQADGFHRAQLRVRSGAPVWSGTLGVGEPISIQLPRVKREPALGR